MIERGFTADINHRFLVIGGVISGWDSWYVSYDEENLMTGEVLSHILRLDYDLNVLERFTFINDSKECSIHSLHADMANNLIYFSKYCGHRGQKHRPIIPFRVLDKNIVGVDSTRLLDIPLYNSIANLTSDHMDIEYQGFISRVNLNSGKVDEWRVDVDIPFLGGLRYVVSGNQQNMLMVHIFIP